MEVLIKNQIHNPEKILKEFLFLAIFIPPGARPPTENILKEPELMRYYEDWGRKNDHALFALYAGQVIGACWSRCFPDEAPGYGTVSSNIPELSIALKPEFRGKGVGSQLLEIFLDKLQSAYDSVSLSVHFANPAIYLYQRFGFERYHKKVDSVIMIKRFKLQTE